MCTGECRGVSDKPGTCQAETCSKHGQPLEKCGCTDGKHEEKSPKQDGQNGSGT